MTAQALIIPTSGPVQEIALSPGLDALYRALECSNVEAQPMTPAVGDQDAYWSTVYVDGEAKFTSSPVVNWRATDFMVPGIGIRWGDYIAGPMLIVGFDPRAGEHRPELPAGVTARARLIEREAGPQPAEASP